MKLRLDSQHRLRYKSTAYKTFHFFGKFLLFLFILFLFLVGFTQTSYFRNLLRDKIVEYAKGELNGNLNIESIYGTLFSSLTIKNLSYSIEGVEFVSAKTIHISINPLALIQHKIVINKFFLENAYVNFVQFKDGKWITEKLLKHPLKKDTTPPAKFDYDVIIKSTTLSDCQFVFKKNVDSSDYFKYTVYDTFNYDDLTISKLNLQFASHLNFSENEYELKIKELKFNSNARDFAIEDLNLNIAAKNNSLSLTPIEIKTSKSNLKIDLKVDDFNLSDTYLFEKLPEKIFSAQVQAEPFNFDDLHSLIPEVNMLKGKIFIQAEASGSLKNLNVEYITAKYDSTNLNVQGVLNNLDEPDKLYIKARIVNSELLMKDISRLLPLYEIPEFGELGKLKLDIIHEGTPLNFKTDFKILNSTGEITGFSKFNFNRRIPSYSIDLSTKNLELHPFTKIDGVVNSSLKINGEGFDPQTINIDLNFLAHHSSFAGNKIDSISLIALGKNKNFDFDFIAISEKANLSLKGLIDFKNKELPLYNLSFQLQNIDPAKNLFLKDFNGNLNIAGNLKGKSFDLDKLDGEFNLSIFESILNNIEINESKVALIVNHSNSSQKKIHLSSDFVDLDLNGNYNLSDVLKILPDKIKIVQELVDEKIKLFKNEKDTLLIVSNDKKLIKQKSKNEKFEEPVFDLNYSINFKEFNLINVFLKNLKINLDGNISGKLSSDNEKFTFENHGSINDFWIIDLEKSTRARNSNFNFSLEIKHNNVLKNRLKLLTLFTSEKILTSSKIEDINIKVDYDSDTFKYRVQSVVDSLLLIRSEGTFDISSPIFRASIDKATIIYKKYKLTNLGPLDFSFSKDKIEFDHFVLRRKKELFKIAGELGYSGNQNLRFNIDNLDLYDLVLNFFPNITEEIGGELSVAISMNGTANSPLIKGEFDLQNLSIGTDQLGTFSGKVDYQNKLVSVFASYIDSIYAGNDFELNGYFPVDLSFKDVKERLKRDKKFEFNLTLNDFNLQPLRAIVPVFKDIDGSLIGNVKVSGILDKPEFSGTITSRNMNFVLAQNNLKYSTDINLSLKENKIVLEKLEFANVNTRKRGRLYTTAEVEIDNRGIKHLILTTRGSLLVLGAESRAVSPKVYGDLFFETSSPIVIEGSYNDYYVSGDVNIRESSLIIPPIQSEYSSEEESFVFNYVDYSPEVDPADIAFLQAEKELRKQKKPRARSSSNVLSRVRGKIKLSMKNNVSMVLIFNQELNQRLFADLRGEVIYNFSEDQTSTQGEIELTQDSYLVFYQRFLAAGKIRFESELSNPYLDVTATYSNYYVKGDTLNQQVKDVLIKLHLVGKVTELGKNLINNRENIEVSIDGTVDRSKDASDVVAFILLGKFKEDLTAEDKTGALSNWGGTFQSAASSLLGSVVTNFANSILGDVLRNVEFKKFGEETRFSFEGRVKDVRFKVGGGTDVFQNFALANIQIEYPVSERLFLRLVRKPTQMQVSRSTEMINEIGLKYKVEF